MEIRRCSVVEKPAPNTRVVREVADDGSVYMRGDGSLAFVCGDCGAALLEGVELDEVQVFVFRCGKCGAYNQTPQ